MSNTMYTHKYYKIQGVVDERTLRIIEDISDPESTFLIEKPELISPETKLTTKQRVWVDNHRCFYNRIEITKAPLKIGFSTKDVKDALLGTNELMRSTGMTVINNILSHIMETEAHVFLLRAAQAEAITCDKYGDIYVQFELWEKRR